MTELEQFRQEQANAKWYERYNPCHYLHADWLDGMQYTCELFAPHCQCCAGTRIIVLMCALWLAVLGGPVCNLIASILGAIVMAMVLVDNWMTHKAVYDEAVSDLQAVKAHVEAQQQKSNTERSDASEGHVDKTDKPKRKRGRPRKKVKDDKSN